MFRQTLSGPTWLFLADVSWLILSARYSFFPSPSPTMTTTFRLIPTLKTHHHELLTHTAPPFSPLSPLPVLGLPLLMKLQSQCFCDRLDTCGNPVSLGDFSADSSFGQQ